MANISSAHGKITLKGEWTQAALDAFMPVLDMWEFYGQYGIQSCGGFDLDHPTASFYGCGRWSFTGTLSEFEDWTRSWLKDQPKNQKGELIHPLTAEQYENFLQIMHDNDLSIEIDFEDEEEGFGFHDHEIGVFTSDGERLNYEVIFCEPVIPSWDDYDRSALKAAVEYFERFIEDPDRKRLNKWVKNNVAPTDIFEENGYDEEIIEYYANQSEDPFVKFYHKFLPDTEDWEEFSGLFEEMFGYPPEESDEYYDEDEDEDEDEEYDESDEEEDVNDWDTEPQYPIDDIDSLAINGKTFVLTGEFQNCDGDREKIQEMIVLKGGRCTSAVSGKTDYLVLGDFGEVGAKKLEKALEQREKGKDIKIIAEYDLFRFLQ